MVTRNNIMLAMVIVILITICFLIWMKTNKKLVREMFINNSDEAYQDIITSIFKTFLFRFPTPEEIQHVRNLMNNPNDAENATKYVKTTKEFKDITDVTPHVNSFHHEPTYPVPTDETELDNISIKEKSNLYQSIISEYDQNLWRMPTMNELYYYAFRMETNKNFDKNRLRAILQSSREYEILQKNQSNIVNGELPMNITDEQISYEVEEIYKSVTNKSEIKIPMEMFQFLKYKYKEYELNENRLKELITLLKKLDDKNIDMTSFYKNEKQTSNDSPHINMNTFSYETFTNSPHHTTTDESTTEKQTGFGDFSNEYFEGNTHTLNNNNGLTIEEQHDNNTQIADNKNNNMQASSKTNVNTNTINTKKNNIHEESTNQQLNNTKHDKKTTAYHHNNSVKRPPTFDEYYGNKNRNALAQIHYDRNKSELSVGCKRNNKYLNADDNMVLFPEFKWSIPQPRPPICVNNNNSDYNPTVAQTALIGTLLSELE